MKIRPSQSFFASSFLFVASFFFLCNIKPIFSFLVELPTQLVEEYFLLRKTFYQRTI